MNRVQREALDRLLTAIYQLRESGFSANEVMAEAMRINRQFDADLAGLQMLQEELGHLTPPGNGDTPAPRVSLQQPPAPEGDDG